MNELSRLTRWPPEPPKGWRVAGWDASVPGYLYVDLVQNGLNRRLRLRLAKASDWDVCIQAALIVANADVVIEAYER